MSLTERLRAEIAATGPISVAEFMLRCLHDPSDGYYATRPALGPAGDFVTAPLVSQMFGELLGLWAVETWNRLGRPERVRLVELGPGDGTLIADALRAAAVIPAFLGTVELILVEVSAPLAALQRERLAQARVAPTWARSLGEIEPGAPVILIANELLDCLPARQFVRVQRGWAERVVGLGEHGGLAFGLIPTLKPASAPDDLEPGLVWEVSAAQAALGSEVGALVAREGGCALFVDYGRAVPEPGDTLQALRRHAKVDPLASAGEADLTVWADFPAVLAAARETGAETAPIVPQGEFLRRLGIERRAAGLARARPDMAEVVERQLARLTAPEQMGTLFKAAAVHQPGLVPPGFEEAA
ncbi:MAG TPA: SAM-dependent methyltransferase [Caulobacteraceae bacterium]|nr:SAM-dependent methyltransferase [Caulobacteraceae bacterium]